MTMSAHLAKAMNEIVAATHKASADAGWWTDPQTGEHYGLLPVQWTPS